MQPFLFHLSVTAVDFLGYRSQHEMTVIAADENELRDEIENFFHLRDVTDSWEINAFLERRQLTDDDPHAINYREKGAHSFH